MLVAMGGGYTANLCSSEPFSFFLASSFLPRVPRESWAFVD